MVKDIINQMKLDLAAHNRKKEDLLEYYVQLRLNASLESYYKEIQQSLNNLLSKESLGYMKKVLSKI